MTLTHAVVVGELGSSFWRCSRGIVVLTSEVSLEYAWSVY